MSFYKYWLDEDYSSEDLDTSYYARGTGPSPPSGAEVQTFTLASDAWPLTSQAEPQSGSLATGRNSYRRGGLTNQGVRYVTTGGSEPQGSSYYCQVAVWYYWDQDSWAYRNDFSEFIEVELNWSSIGSTTFVVSDTKFRILPELEGNQIAYNDDDIQSYVTVSSNENQRTLKIRPRPLIMENIPTGWYQIQLLIGDQTSDKRIDLSLLQTSMKVGSSCSRVNAVDWKDRYREATPITTPTEENGTFLLSGAETETGVIINSDQTNTQVVTTLDGKPAINMWWSGVLYINDGVNSGVWNNLSYTDDDVVCYGTSILRRYDFDDGWELSFGGSTIIYGSGIARVNWFEVIHEGALTFPPPPADTSTYKTFTSADTAWPILHTPDPLIIPGTLQQERVETSGTSRIVRLGGFTRAEVDILFYLDPNELSTNDGIEIGIASSTTIGSVLESIEGWVFDSNVIGQPATVSTPQPGWSKIDWAGPITVPTVIKLKPDLAFWSTAQPGYVTAKVLFGSAANDEYSLTSITTRINDKHEVVSLTPEEVTTASGLDAPAASTGGQYTWTALNDPDSEHTLSIAQNSVALLGNDVTQPLISKVHRGQIKFNNDAILCHAPGDGKSSMNSLQWTKNDTDGTYEMLVGGQPQTNNGTLEEIHVVQIKSQFRV